MNILLPSRKTVVTPYDLPLFWRESYQVISGTYATGGSAAGTSYFTAIPPSSFEGVSYTYTTTANIANTWKTIVDVSGSGDLIDVESRTCVSAAPSITISLRITLDGKPYTFSRVNGTSAAMRLFLGLYIPVGQVSQPEADTSVRQATSSLYGSAFSPSALSAGFLYKPAVATILERMLGKLPTFRNSLKVETMSSVNGTGVADYYAACRYRLY